MRRETATESDALGYEALSLPGVLIFRPRVHEDERGYFYEAYQQERYRAAGVNAEFVQDNVAGSRRGVLRGLHYQLGRAQGKLVWVTAGEIFDVCVDLRRSSPHFGKWLGLKLSAHSREQLWIPAGFAHGYYTLGEWAQVSYKVTDFYDPPSERTLAWDDGTVGIEWPLIDGEPPTLSGKDANGSTLEELEVFE